MLELIQITDKYQPLYIESHFSSLDGLHTFSIQFFKDVAHIFDAITRARNVERNPTGFSINDAPSLHPKGISCFGLKNKSGHDLDVLLKVPPPPDMMIRVPTAQARHHIEGLHGPSQYKKLTFTEETLIVVEVKATMGKNKTPGFYAKTQGKGGISDKAGRERGRQTGALVENRKRSGG